jgi:hypothetical protein
MKPMASVHKNKVTFIFTLPPDYVGTLAGGTKHASRGAHASTASGSGSVRKTRSRDDVRALIVIAR